MVYPPVTRDAYETEVRGMSKRYGDPVFRRITLNDPQPNEREVQARERKRFPELARKFVARVKPKGARLGGALRKRGLASFAQKNFDAAYRDLAPVLVSNPDDVELRYAVALCQTELGALEGARANLTICLTAKHRWGQAYAARARVFLAMGADGKAKRDNELARRYGAQPFTTAATTLPAPVSKEQLLQDPTRAADWVARAEARRLRADETYQERLRRLREAGDLTALGAFLFRESQVTLTEAVEPRATPRPYRAKNEMRELAAAEKALDHALKRNQNDPKALAYRAACIVRRGNARNARAFIERAIDLAPADPDVLEIVAHVLEYAARVNMGAARGLRAVDTWEDAHYIYYRYPSEAERRQARALEAEARRLMKRARAGLVIAVRNAGDTPRAAYYRCLLAQWDGNLTGALEESRAATKADPKFRRAWLKRTELATRLRKRNESYEAQFQAANLDHTTAAPLLKLAWIHIRRGALELGYALSERAIIVDPADPRGLAYRGVIEELRNQRGKAGPWYRAAMAVHDVNARSRGVYFDGKRKVSAEDAGRRMHYAYRAAQALPDAVQAKAMLEAAALTYSQVEASERYAPVPRAMLPAIPDDIGRLPDTSNVETFGAWVVLRYANRLAGAGQHGNAIRNYRWVLTHETRKPPNRSAGSLIWEPVALARAYIAESYLAAGEREKAKQACRSIGHPRQMGKAGVRELEEVRRRVEHKLGGDAPRPKTLTEMRRQNLLKQRRALVAKKTAQQRILNDRNASADTKAAAQIEIADLDAKIESLDQQIASVNRGR